MKKTILTVLLTLTVTAGTFYGAAKAGIWTSLSGAFSETVESKLFAIEAQGNNIRGYIFENPANKGKFCIASASSNGSGLSCDWSK